MNVLDLVFDIETTGLEMNTDRIICICVHNIQAKEKKTFMNLDERIILEEFWGYLRKFEAVRLIGFHSEGFDIPFLIRRSLVRKVRVAFFQSIDLRKVANGFFFSYNAYQKGDLKFWADVFGIPVKTNGGDMMLKLFVDKQFKEIEEHCLEDVNITHQLFLRCKECGMAGV